MKNPLKNTGYEFHRLQPDNGYAPKGITYREKPVSIDIFSLRKIGLPLILTTLGVACEKQFYLPAFLYILKSAS
jgi:hypothetical protein